MPVIKNNNGKYVIAHELGQLSELRQVQESLLSVISSACSSDDKENFEFGMNILQVTELLKSTLLDERQLAEYEKTTSHNQTLRKVG